MHRLNPFLSLSAQVKECQAGLFAGLKVRNVEGTSLSEMPTMMKQK